MSNIEELLKESKKCPCCGKVHKADVKDVLIEKGAIEKIPYYIEKYGKKKVFLLYDANTYNAAGKRVEKVLKNAGIPFTPFELKMLRAEPDEHAVGSVAFHMDTTCDMFISVGSGVINDIGKVVSNIAHMPYMIVGTAPSMDGYASGTSSVIRDGLKYSLSSKCPEIVIGDLDVLKDAPIRMIQAGVGDLFAKFVSIGEWRISNIINGEYYCQDIADLVNLALKTCLDNIDGIVKRDEKAISSVMEGMVLSGIAANYAGISRPVSGMEHYISHICDMRGVEFNMHTDFHGIQCGVGTVIVLKIYEQLRDIRPDREKALAFVNKFSYEDWKKFLRKNLGNSAEAMILNEEKEGKYDLAKHKARLEVIINKWDEIEKVIHEFPTADEVIALLKKIGAPTTFEEIGFTKEEERNAILMSKDIRDKYVGSRLLWDLGLLDEIK